MPSRPRLSPRQPTGPGNIVEVCSSNLGTAFYIGPGAGRFPTANSIVTDMLAIADGSSAVPFETKSDMVIDPDTEGEFYVRFNVKDQPGIVADVGALCAKYNVSIHAVMQVGWRRGRGRRMPCLSPPPRAAATRWRLFAW